jgi:excisionase family DNA binding protein
MATQITGRTSRPGGRLLAIPATADRLGCSENHIYRLIAAGELDAIDIAQPGARKAKTRVSEANLDAYIAARTRRTGAAPSAPDAVADRPMQAPRRRSTPSRRSPLPPRGRAEIGLDPSSAA